MPQQDDEGTRAGILPFRPREAGRPATTRAGGDGAHTAILPYNPEPAAYQVHYERGRDGRIHTTIARSWRLEDARRCSLCPIGRCTATEGRFGETALCLKHVDRLIPEWEAPSFRDVTGAAAADRSDKGSGSVA